MQSSHNSIDDYRKMDADLEDGTEVILEGDIDYWTEGGKINLNPWEVIVVGHGDRKYRAIPSDP